MVPRPHHTTRRPMATHVGGPRDRAPPLALTGSPSPSPPPPPRAVRRLNITLGSQQTAHPAAQPQSSSQQPECAASPDEEAEWVSSCHDQLSPHYPSEVPRRVLLQARARSRRRRWPFTSSGFPKPAPVLARGAAIATPGGGELIHASASLELGINAHQLRTRTQRRTGPAENRIE